MKTMAAFGAKSIVTKKANVLFGVALVAAVLPVAHAERSAASSAVLTLTYSLTDLDLNDGITPSYTSNPVWAFADVAGVDNVYDLRYMMRNDTLSPLSGIADLGADRVASSVMGNLRTPGGVTLSTSALTSDADGDLGVNSAYASISTLDTLSANTAITVHVNYA